MQPNQPQIKPVDLPALFDKGVYTIRINDEGQIEGVMKTMDMTTWEEGAPQVVVLKVPELQKQLEDTKTRIKEFEQNAANLKWLLGKIEELQDENSSS